jgi:hypothetical protein
VEVANYKNVAKAVESILDGNVTVLIWRTIPSESDIMLWDRTRNLFTDWHILKTDTEDFGSRSSACNLYPGCARASSPFSSVIQVKARIVPQIGSRTHTFLPFIILPFHAVCSELPTASFNKLLKLFPQQAVEAYRVCEMLRIPQCPDNRLTDGGEVVSPTHRPRFIAQKHYLHVSGTHFC